MEERRVLAADVEQRLDRRVGDVVGDVAHLERRGVAAQLDVLVVPVAHPMGVELAEQRGLLAEDPMELPVGRRALFGSRREDPRHQLVAGQLGPSPSGWNSSRLVRIE